MTFFFRDLLCQPQRQQSLDEDGAGSGAGWPRQLSPRGAGSRRCAKTHQRS